MIPLKTSENQKNQNYWKKQIFWKITSLFKVTTITLINVFFYKEYSEPVLIKILFKLENLIYSCLSILSTNIGELSYLKYLRGGSNINILEKKIKAGWDWEKQHCSIIAYAFSSQTFYLELKFWQMRTHIFHQELANKYACTNTCISTCITFINGFKNYQRFRNESAFCLFQSSYNFNVLFTHFTHVIFIYSCNYLRSFSISIG